MQRTSQSLADDPLTLAIKNGRLFVRLASFLTLMSGISLAWEPLLRHTSHHFSGYFLPVNARSAADFTSLIVGLFLVYLAYELSQRKHSAWLVTLGTALVSLVVEIGIDEPFIHSIFTITLIIVLLIGRGQFIVKTHVANFRQALGVLAGSILFALLYGTLGFRLLDSRDFGIDFSLTSAFGHTLKEYTLMGSGGLVPHDRYSRWFLESFSLVGIATGAYCLYNILRPLRYELRTLPAERERAERLLQTYGGEIDDYFKLWPHDKSYFFSNDGEAFIAYAVARGVAVCFANPEGNPESITKVLYEFREFALNSGWIIAFIAASDKYAAVFRGAGFSSLLVGADAVIDIDKFLGETVRNKYFRNIMNRFEKCGAATSRYMPPHSPELIEELSDVSGDWLKIPGHKQWRFITGYFSSRYFERTPFFVVRDNDDRAVAFVNELPSFKAGEATVDLMRHKRSAPKNVMDYLFVKLMIQLQSEGVRRFNLGLSPLARQSFDQSGEKLLDYIYLASQRFISTKGLHQYKSKFDPTWEPRYVYYIGSKSSLPLIGLSLSKLSTYKHKK
jgi:phosphatidylglycerol lysyltransferase